MELGTFGGPEFGVRHFLGTYFNIPPSTSRLEPQPCMNLAGPGTGPGTIPGISAPAFFDGYPRTIRPRESPSMPSCSGVEGEKWNFLMIDLRDDLVTGYLMPPM